MSERDIMIHPELQRYPRLPSNDHEDARDYVPSAYVSIQSRVNSDPIFEEQYITKLISEGWVRLESIDSILFNSLRGKHFKYRLNGKGMSGESAGTFRSGGIVLGMKEEDIRYVLYKSYNGCVFPIQLKDLKEIYIKDPKTDIVKFSVLTAKTKFPVIIKNQESGSDEIVFYAKTENLREKFLVTKTTLRH